jgi:hypothetical protein
MEWDGLDQSGRRVSGGVYFVRAMMPDGTHLTRKIALVR